MRDRILRLRRAKREATEALQAAPPAYDSLSALEKRVAHLERMVEGLQDAVHREVSRMNHEIEELRKRIEPGEMSRALSEDARHRGL
jgi:predicted  nucleic acid-binding Zn-ribbon protein